MPMQGTPSGADSSVTLSTADHSVSPPRLTIPRRYNAAADLIGRNLAAGRGDKVAYFDDYGSCSYLELEERSVAGGSDGNLVGQLVPVLDGLGPEGSGAHADDEHVLIASLAVRAELLAMILREPGL